MYLKVYVMNSNSFKRLVLATSMLFCFSVKALNASGPSLGDCPEDIIGHMTKFLPLRDAYHLSMVR